MMNLILWLLYFIPAIAIELVCYILAPLVACFIRTEPRHDVVKRLNKQVVTLQRDYIIKPLYWFQTHDNAVDEWWYGMYNTDHWFAFARAWTQADYDRSRAIRWYCRVMWLWRNCAYGFHYALFSRPKETACIIYSKGIEGNGFWYELKLFKRSFQFECHVPGEFLTWIYFTVSFCWVMLNYQNHYLAAALGISVAATHQLIKDRYLSINIGWKAHKTTARLLYANRIIGFRKY